MKNGVFFVVLALVVVLVTMVYYHNRVTPSIEAEYETTVSSSAELVTSGNGCASVESFTSVNGKEVQASMITCDDGTRAFQSLDTIYYIDSDGDCVVHTDKSGIHVNSLLSDNDDKCLALSRCGEFLVKFSAMTKKEIEEEKKLNHCESD